MNDRKLWLYIVLKIDNLGMITIFDLKHLPSEFSSTIADYKDGHDSLEISMIPPSSLTIRVQIMGKFYA